MISRRMFTRCLSIAGLSSLFPLLGERGAQAATGALPPEPARSLARIYRHLGIDAPVPESSRIDLVLPDVAENGANVPVTVEVALPGTTRIALVAEGNYYPLVAEVAFEATAEAWFQTRIRLAEGRSTLRVLALSDGRWFSATRGLNVITGGCRPESAEPER